MHHVFISYSRRDSAFVKRLSSALESRGSDTWVDWEDIPPTATFMDEIRRAIDASDSFLFVISPDSCRSPVCNTELAHAAAGGKRLFPIVHRTTAAADVPADVASINWVSFEDERLFDDALAQLTIALDTDLEWVRAHTELLVRARQWESRGQSRAALLRGVELSTAEQQTAKHTGKLPLVVPLQQQFVVASRQNATRTLRTIVAAVSVALVVTAVLAVVAFNLSRLADSRRQQADEQRRNAETQRGLAETRRQEADRQATIARTERDRAETATEIATRERETAVSERNRAEDTARMITAQNLADSDPTSAALLLLELHDPLGRGLPAVSAMRRVAEQPIARAVMRGHTGIIFSSAFSPDGQRIVTASEDGTARVWRADGLGVPVVLKHGGKVMFAAFSPDGRFVVTGGDDRAARVWPATGGTPLVLGGHGGTVRWAAVSPDDEWVLTRGDDNTPRLWSKRGRLMGAVEAPLQAQIRDVVFTADGFRAVATTRENVAVVWTDDAALAPVRLTGHTDAINSVTFSRDATRVVTSSSDGTVRIWNSDGTGEPVILRGPRTHFRSARLTADGLRVVGTGDDLSVVTWLSSGAGTPVVRRASENVMRLEVSPDGSRFTTVADARDYHLAWIWRSDAPAEGPMVLAGHEGRVYSAVFSPDSSQIVTTGTDGTVRVWPASGSPEPFVAVAHDTFINDARFDRTGVRVATTGDDKITRVWMLDGRSPSLTLAAGVPLPATFAVAPPVRRTISPDGRHTVHKQGGSAQGDRTAVIAAVNGREPPIVLRGHTDMVYATEFSPDGRLVLTSGEDGTVRIWDADGHGEPLVLRLPADQKIVMDASFSPDGTRVLTKTYTTSHRPNDVRVWRVTAATLLSFLRQSTTACLPTEIRMGALDENETTAHARFDACERARTSTERGAVGR